MLKDKTEISILNLEGNNIGREGAEERLERGGGKDA